MKKRRQIKPSSLRDGFFWVRLFVPLRGGHYHREWLPARVQGGRVQLFGSNSFKPMACPVLEKALWRGPIEPPPLQEAEDGGLALQQAEDHRPGRRRRLASTPTTDIEPCPATRAVAGQIVDGFIETVDTLRVYYREHPQHRLELVEKIAVLIERATR